MGSAGEGDQRPAGDPALTDVAQSTDARPIDPKGPLLPLKIDWPGAQALQSQFADSQILWPFSWIGACAIK